MSMKESITEFLRSFLPGGIVVEVGICGGTDSGNYVSPPFYPVFPLSLNVVIECCMKCLS